MKDRRIVITGIGAVSPLGNTASETWAAMKEGRSGIGIIESIDTTPFPVHIGGEVKNFDATPYFKKDPKAVRRCDRFEQLAMGAAVMAMEDAALDPENTRYYFYALNPATGLHEFSRTYDEHMNRLAKFNK